MLETKITPEQKGWLTGPWNSAAPFAVGWARQVTDVPHYHAATHETYVVIAGEGTLRVDGRLISAHPGEVFQIDPGEIHGWVSTSPEFLMIMVHCPVDPSDKVLAGDGH